MSNLPRRSSAYSTSLSSRRSSRSYDDMEELTRELDESLSFQPRNFGYDLDPRDQHLSPYDPRYNPHRPPRQDSGYNSRELSRDRDRDYPRSGPDFQPSFIAPRAPRSSTSDWRSTGQRTPSGAASGGRPLRETRISDNGHVIYNDSSYVDSMRSSKDSDSRYYAGSSLRPRSERGQEPEPRYRERQRQRAFRDPRDPRDFDGPFREEDEDEYEEDYEYEYRRR
ncbi:hypothetical protein P7C71_g2696, partial [Lecanoromycetidae sp. Uapishka_2]